MPRAFAPLRPPGSQPARVIRPSIEPGRRVLAVSDVHGNLPFLKGALETVNFAPDDVLVIVGDLLEKGKESLATLRYVMDLQKTHTVYMVSGNCDYIDQCFLSGPGLDKKLWPVLDRFWRGSSVLMQLGAEIGVVPQRLEDLPALRAALLERFPEETGFLLELPHILEAGNFIFVHGGVPREDRLEELEAYDCMKNDDFRGQGHSFQKWVVVGHWPVTLYDARIQRSAPSSTMTAILPPSTAAACSSWTDSSTCSSFRTSTGTSWMIPGMTASPPSPLWIPRSRRRTR